MPGTLDLLLRLAISMAVVMGVMGLAARLLRRRANGAARLGTSMFARGPRARRAHEPELEVVCRRPLSKGASVALVKTPGKKCLLGVTDRAVTLLAELPEQVPPRLAEDFPIVLSGDEDGRTPSCIAAPHLATDGEGQRTAWKLALDSLRERTVRR